jgi:hypothetical protein
MIESTSKFKVADIIYNKDGFAVALGYWDGDSQLSLGCRWHTKDGLGYPQTYGKPQWMEFPRQDISVQFEPSKDPLKARVTITLT